MKTHKNNGVLPDLMTPHEVAALRGVVPATVYVWLKHGLKHETDRLGRIFIRRLDAAEFSPKPVGYPKGRPRKAKPEAARTRTK